MSVMKLKQFINPILSLITMLIISLKLSVVGLLLEASPVNILFSFYFDANVIKTPIKSSIIKRLPSFLKCLYNAEIL
jgi:hypothetical protein